MFFKLKNALNVSKILLLSNSINRKPARNGKGQQKTKKLPQTLFQKTGVMICTVPSSHTRIYTVSTKSECEWVKVPQKVAP